MLIVITPSLYVCIALKFLIVANKHNKRKCFICRGIVIDLTFPRARRHQCILFTVLFAASRKKNASESLRPLSFLLLAAFRLLLLGEILKIFFPGKNEIFSRQIQVNF